MGLINYMREKIRHFLRVDNANNLQIMIKQRLDYFGNASKNRIWYRGDSQELSDLYSQLEVSETMFWKATSTKGMEIRKIHTGLPKLIAKSLTNIIISDYNGVDIEQPTLKDIWEDICKDNKIDKKIKQCIKDILVVGDGAFKVSFDKSISEKTPIIEFISGENVDFIYKRGRITEVVFTTEYFHNQKRYIFKEHYGYGYIKYELLNENGKKLPLNFIPQTSWIKGEGVSFEKTVLLAVPVIFGDSEQYPGRGESIFDGKTDSFDALDEAWSQWMDALRAGRTKQYIPECFIPRNPDTGESLKPNAFDNRFIEVGNDMSEKGGGNKIYTEQSAIPHDSYLATYITALDLCLQGIISPSTLGIDVKKLDNAEAQREKEKTTLYTRGNIIELLNEVIPELVISAVCGYQEWNKQKIEKPTGITVKFGEYANPSFESQIETISKGKTSGIMSIESSIDELYGDSKDSDWKAGEVARIKAEQGIATVDDTSVGNDLENVLKGEE